MNKRSAPLIGQLEITYKCNFRCPICYNSKVKRQELSTSQFKKLIDDFAAEGCFYINISGGEPLLRSDFFELYQYCRQVGIRPSIESNGSILTKKHLQLFTDYTPLIYHITLYGVSDIAFCAATNAPRQFNNIVKENIARLKDAGINVHLRTPFSVFNYQDADNMFEYCHELGVPYTFNP